MKIQYDEYETERAYDDFSDEQDSTIQFIKKNTVTVILAMINILIFLILEIMGDTENSQFMIDHGAVYPVLLQEQGQYWRLFTATCMHFGLMHLVNNMVMLVATGQYLESALGHFRFFLLYVIAGIGGSALSYAQMLYSNDYAVSAGASGAIFGIVGALLWVVIRNKGHYGTLTTRGLLVMIALCLYYGVTAGDVDNWGHIGGLIGGFVLCMILYHKKQQKY